MKLTLIFATRYNGVYLVADDNTEVTDEMQNLLDEVSDTLPSMTYDMVEKFDTSLTKKQINQLIAEAKKIIAPVITDADISFEYDDSST